MGDHHEIIGSNVILRVIQKENLSDLFKLYQDPEFLDDFGYIEGAEQTEQHLLSWFNGLQNTEEEKVYSIFQKESLQWMGFVTLMDINVNEQEAWLVIGLQKKWRNQGYGKQCLRKLIEVAFNEMELKTLRLSVLGHNSRALSLYKKLGFEVEMIFPKLQCPNLFGVDILQLQLTHEKWRN